MALPPLPPLETLLPIITAVALAILLVVYLVVDAATKPNTFYPSTFQLGAAYFKLALSPFYKVGKVMMIRRDDDDD